MCRDLEVRRRNVETSGRALSQPQWWFVVVDLGYIAKMDLA